MNFLLLIIYIIIIVFIFSGNEINNDIECPRDTPLFNINTNNCVYEVYDENKHVISNDIIKNQWLNRRNLIGIKGGMYINSALSSNGDLIIESFPDSYDKSIRFLYVIKSNGRALFYEEENNEFTYQINITTSDLMK